MFETTTKEDWLAKVEKDLKGRPLTDLNFELAGHAFSPFHHPDDWPSPPPPVPNMPTGHRTVGIRIDATGDPAAANELALEALNRGADHLVFELADLLTFGKQARRQLLAGVITDIVTVTFLRAEPMDDYDLLTFQDLHGDYHYQAISQGLAEALFFAASDLPDREEDFGPTIHLRMTDEYYTNVARLRACRLCWALIRGAYGYPHGCQLIAHLDFSAGDEQDNKIRASAQALGAVVGGANGLVIDPSDGRPGTSFTRRVALNLQHVLAYESGVAEARDPAAGSYFLESLTDRVAEDTWAKIRQLSADPIYQNF